MVTGFSLKNGKLILYLNSNHVVVIRMSSINKIARFPSNETTRISIEYGGDSRLEFQIFEGLAKNILDAFIDENKITTYNKNSEMKNGNK